MAPAVRELDCQFALESVQRRALVVDEDARDLAYHAVLLEAQGFDVTRCRFYADAVRLIERELFDLVVVEQGTAAFEGRIVMKFLQRFMPYTPCVVVTRHVDNRCHSEALELGATEYLAKPLSRQNIGHLLNKLFGVHPHA